MGGWKIGSNILGVWADRCPIRNENMADKENTFRILLFAGKGSLARRIFHCLVSMSLFRGVASKKNFKMAILTLALCPLSLRFVVASRLFIYNNLFFLYFFSLFYYIIVHLNILNYNVKRYINTVDFHNKCLASFREAGDPAY